MSDLVTLECEKGIGLLSLNRPEKLNCFTNPMLIKLQESLESCEKSADIRVVVLTGKGRAFCAGGDLEVLNSCTCVTYAEKNLDIANSAILRLFYLSKPTIAMVNGVAAGAGFNLALCCDMIIASEKASFIQSFSKVGIASDCGGHWLLRRAVGPYIAKELMLTCRAVSAQEGLAFGFVNRVVQHDILEAETMKLALSIAQGAPLAMAAIKKLIDAGDNMAFDEMLEEEKKQQAKLLLSDDCKEGIDAFLNKREPVFSGM